MRHDGVTFDPAAPACDMTASLLTQRPRHATCRGVRDACQVCQIPGLTSLPRQRPSGTPAKFARGVCGRRRIWPGTCRGRVSGQLPCLGRGRSDRNKCTSSSCFASGFLSVCEGKGLYVRRACQYVILRISSPPCAWLECSFYRRPIYCLSAPYASHGVLEIHEP